MADKNSGNTLINAQAAQIAGQVANWAAQMEFQKERFRLMELPEYQTKSQLELDKFAWEKANSTWERAYKEASITGTYNGQPTMEWLTQQAQMTGVINGQQTLQGALTEAQIAQMNASSMNTQKLTDLEYQKFGFQREQYSQEYQMKLQDQQARLTGYIGGLPTFEREQWEASQGQATLQLLASLRGPENAFAQLRVLQGMDDGTRALAQKWAGIKQGSSFGTATGAPPPASIPGLLNVYQPAPASVAQPMLAAPAATTVQVPASSAGYTIDPAGAQANESAYNYQATPAGSTMVYPPGVQAPANQPQVSTYTPMSADVAQQVAQAATGGLVTPSTYTLPSQINAKEYNKSTGYEKALGWASYENDGWDKSVAQELFQKSLPKYGVSSGTQGKVAM